MPRPIWKGYITFGLVTIPVVLYSAEKNNDIRFKLIDSRDQAKIHYERINERTGRAVPWEKIAKGYEYDDEKFVVMDDKVLKSIAGENSKTIDIESFIEKSSLDIMYFDKPYYLVPDKKGEKGYAILRDILDKTKKIAIAKVIIHTRQYLAALLPIGNALMLNAIRYAAELRDYADFDVPAPTAKAVKISVKEMEVAKQLVDSMTAKWNPQNYVDEYQLTLKKWIDEKIHEETPRAKLKRSSKTPAKANNIIDFVDLLKKSVRSKKSPPKPKPKKHKAK